jgi:hypothetical protein
VIAVGWKTGTICLADGAAENAITERTADDVITFLIFIVFSF